MNDKIATLPAIIVNPKDFGIEESKVPELLGNLPQIKNERTVLEVQYNRIILMDIENPETAKKASELRKKIKDNRTKGIEVWHRTTKDFYLKGGQFVDSLKRVEIAINERMENALLEIENYREIKEAERKNKLKEDRLSELTTFAEFVPSSINFGEISEEEFVKIKNGAKLQFEAKELALAKAEAERVEQVKKEEEERERLVQENIKLKKEADKREAEQKKEKERLKQEYLKQFEIQQKQQEALKAEAEKQAKIIRDQQEVLRKQKEKEEQEQKEKEEQILLEKKAAAKLAKAPIKKKMKLWVSSFTLPELEDTNNTKDLIIKKFSEFKKWAELEIENL